MGRGGFIRLNSFAKIDTAFSEQILLKIEAFDRQNSQSGCRKQSLMKTGHGK